MLHRNLSIDDQAAQVDIVKRSESGMINDPLTVSPDVTLADLDKLCGRFHISGLPVVDNDNKLVGIITNRDMRFIASEDYDRLKVSEVMTRENLITGPSNISKEDAHDLLAKHKVEKLPLVDDEGHLTGLITVKDFVKTEQYPDATKDEQGRLRVAAGIGFLGDAYNRASALMEAGVDVLVVDTANGEAKLALDMIRRLKSDSAFNGVDIIGGNVATRQGAQAMIDAGVDHGLRALAGGDVAADDVHAIERGIGLQAANHVESQLGLTVGGVDHEHVHAGFHQSGSTVVGVTQEADAGGNAQTTLFVLGGVRILLGLHEVLHGDQAGEVAFIVNQRQLLDLVLGQQVVGVFLGDVGRAGDEVLAGHDLGNLEPVVILGGDETHVAVGDDADELVVVVNDRQTGDMETAAQLVEISQRHIRADGQRIVDHTGFGALDDVNLSGLVVDGKIAVQHADAATCASSHPRITTV